MFSPSAELSFEIAVGASPGAESDLTRVDLVKGYEGADHGVGQCCSLAGVEALRVVGCAQRDALEFLHDVEGGADDGGVLTESDGAGNRDGAVAQGGQGSVFAAHVVGGGQYVPERGAAENPLSVAVGDLVGWIGASARDQVCGELFSDSSGFDLGEPCTYAGAVECG